jgi:hypothetical protein
VPRVSHRVLLGAWQTAEVLPHVRTQEREARLILLDIPRVPLSMNQLLGRHWRRKHREKTTWMQEIQAAYGPGRYKATGRMRVTITIFNSRQYDQDNAVGSCKIVVDALKTLGFIVDDRAKYLDCSVLQEQSSRKHRHTVIQLEAL